MRKPVLMVILDHLLIFLAFLLVVFYRGYALGEALERTYPWLLVVVILHLLIAFLFDKYNFQRRTSVKKQLLPLIHTNFSATGLASIIIVFLDFESFSRVLLYGTILLTSLFELVLWFLITLFPSIPQKDNNYQAATPKARVAYPKGKDKRPLTASDNKTFLTIRGQAIKQSIIDEIGPGAFEYLKEHVLLGESAIVLSVKRIINIINLPFKNIDTIVNLEKVNNHRFVNKFFETVNAKLPMGGVYSGYCETQDVRKKRIFRRYTPVFGFILYSFDFLITRIAPKLPLTRKAYFSFTKGQNRVMSRAEVLGRLYSCGFEVVDESPVNGWLFFVARKVGRPEYDGNPTYGPLIRLRRIGRHGKIIGVYKMRTMHPFAEYLQPYIYKTNDLQKGGKFCNDYRISTLGALMRKLWIDELPMLFNWLKGDLKLVGVRPLSEHYFNLYTPELQQKRIQVKPGLIPPFYADMPTTMEEIMASEMRYIDAYQKHPYRTDWNYFWKAFVNIVFKNARSK